MELQKTALKDLLKQLVETEISVYIDPKYNGFEIENFSHFQNLLNMRYKKFEKELSQNLDNRSPSLDQHLTNATKKLSEIREHVKDFQKVKLKDSQKRNADSFTKDQLRQINDFLNFQLEIIDKTKIHLLQKLEFVKDPELFTPAMDDTNTAGSPVLHTKIRSNLTKVDLAVLLWLLAEAQIFEFDGSHNGFVKFVEQNFQYFDRGKEIYADMKHIGPLMTKLNDENSSETNPTQSQKELLATLKKIKLPPEKSQLIKNKWKKV